MVLLVLGTTEVLAQWPTDDEPLGFMGCKFFRFKGLWEEVINLDEPEEGTEGICLTVAVASLMNYFQWPVESRFDGVYMTSKNMRFVKPIKHKWNYRLITGGKGATVDCETDDPSLRTQPEDPSWSGLDEIRQLMYVVERSYGHDHEYFHLPGTVCGEYGYYALEHVLRNRFGYAGCRTLDMRRQDVRRQVVSDLKRKIPVIAMKCEHAFVIDGFRVDPVTKKEHFHSTDYVQEGTTMGWFTWKEFLSEGVVAMITNLNPVCELKKGPFQKAFQYHWGDRFVPATSHTSREGLIKIYSASPKPLGDLSIEIRRRELGSPKPETAEILFSTRKDIQTTRFTIPGDHPLPFEVEENTALTLTIRNNDKHYKPIMVMFNDFERQ